MPPSANIRWHYAASTTTTILRNHLTTQHRVDYLTKCQEKGWNEYAEKLGSTDGGSLDTIDSSTKPQIPFSRKVLLDRLVKFIVADDQVS